MHKLSQAKKCLSERRSSVFAHLDVPLTVELICLAAAAAADDDDDDNGDGDDNDDDDSFTYIRTRVSKLSSWRSDQQLSRKLLGFWQ